MSHIPSAAMPHAKPHDHEPEPATPPTPAPVPVAAKRPEKQFPWLAVAAGGALAIGTAVSAAIALRPTAKSTRRRTTTPKTRRKSRND